MERKTLHRSKILCYFIFALFFACFILLRYHWLALTDHRNYIVSLNSHLPQKLEIFKLQVQLLLVSEAKRSKLGCSHWVHFYRHTYLCSVGLYALDVLNCCILLFWSQTLGPWTTNGSLAKFLALCSSVFLET